jgi:biopolymer transport protein ExbB
MIELFKAGGICMWPILFLSVLSLAIFLERLVFLRPGKYVPGDFTYRLFGALRNKAFEEARIICDNNKSSTAKICKDILENTDLPISRLLELAEDSGRSESREIEKYMPTLQVIISLGPLFGFYGTVLGMFKTFVAISQHGMTNVQPLASGISEAIITTAAGLPVAIMTTIFYYIIKYKTDKIIYLMERTVSEVVNTIFKGE